MGEFMLKLLVHLARVDNNLGREEIKLIKKIGQSYDMDNHEIERLMTNPGNMEMRIEGQLSKDEKFDLLFNLVNLMKIDGKNHQKELNFCLRISRGMGFDDRAIFDLVATKFHNISTQEARRKMQKKLRL